MTDNDTRKRMCIYVSIDQHVEGKGYVPSVVTEDEAGHAPMVGQGEFSEPIFWGHDYQKAQKIAADYNRGMGLSEQDVTDIVASSIAAQNRAQAAREEIARKLGREGWR